VELEQWHTGRVVLIGDAAHAGPPMMAQGGCMAMEDAYVLAEVLREAESVESALGSYASRRRPRTDWVQQQSRAWAESYRLARAGRSGNAVPLRTAHPGTIAVREWNVPGSRDE
jgi:2-polyprenyl-6-methoxyphenol hydroxylase-like FAD-dependent oxidoreductase